MSSILTIASQKGGVGKTTTAVNLSAALCLAGKKTLLLDLDPQGNASSGVGFPRVVPSHRTGVGKPPGILSGALSDLGVSGLVQSSQFPNLSVIAASGDLSDLDLIQELQARGLETFRGELRRLAAGFDFVLVDCPPSLGGLPTIALSVSDGVVIPVQCEYYAMEGLSQILPIIQKVRSTTNHELKIEGLVLTMFSEELELSRDVEREVTEYFRDSVFRTIIPRDVVLAEAASHGLPAMEYAPLSRGAWSYVELAREVLEHDRS